jgi:hypothetical protein
MIGTGLTFAVGVGGITGILGAVAWLRGRVSVVEVMQDVGKFSVVAFLLGIAFSGVLAIAAHGRQFSKLSLRLVTALGAGAGLLYWLFLASTGGRSWSPRLAVLNFVVLIVMGSASAAATLLIARRAGSSLSSSDELPSLGEGDGEIVGGGSRSKAEVPRL